MYCVFVLKHVSVTLNRIQRIKITRIVRDRILHKFKSFVRVGPNSARVIVFLMMLGITANLYASGWPPFAFSDSAKVVRGGVVDRLTNGNDSVLDNDFDVEGDELTAELTKGVRHGNLEFRDDGTFRYEHDGGNSNSDSFRYRAFDGTGYSRRTLVTIEIEATPNSPPFVASEVADQEAIEGAAFRLELAGHFGDLDEDDVLRFSARGLPNSNSLRIDANSGVLSGTPVSADVKPTPYIVEITATDRAGASARLTFRLIIFRDNRADLALAITLATNPITLGETAQWNIQIENKGPGNLDSGQLTASWVTSGPSLTVSSPTSCSITGNGTRTPEMICAIGALDARSTLIIDVEGMQDGDGDNSLIGVVTGDDPILENNSALASAQVVAQFSEGPTQTISVSGAGIDAGDLDGDGEIDIVATADQTFIFLNNGNRAVSTPGTSLGSDTAGSAVALLDWNGDGSLDIAIGGLAGRTVEVFINDRNGGFSSTERLQNGQVGSVNDMVAADLNNNGRSELLLTGSSGTVIMRSRSQGGFDQISLSSGAGLDLAVSDIDQDGDQDIIVVRLSDRAVDLHYNNGDGVTFDRVRNSYGSVATVSASDLDGDGLTDLLLGVDGDDLSVPENKVLYQQTDGSFVSGGSFGASPVTALLPGDVNADGWTDVVAVNETGVHQLYLGSGGGDFSLAPEQIVSSGMRRGVLVDFNGDDSLDLIMVGRAANVLEIHANNGIGRLGLGDRIAPDLQLVGEATIEIAVGEEYLDPGATAIDDIDGDITDKIEIIGTINSAVVSTQTVTYGVADKANNSATIQRTVIVGVNVGTGGSGGGIIGPTFVVALSILSAALRRRKTRPSTSSL